MSRYVKPKATGRIFRYKPVGWDVFDPKVGIEPGTLVRKTQPAGCPRNGTMGHTFIEDAETGAFLGLVLLSSLAKEQ